MKRRHSAFTLVELLVVIAIVAVLVGILLPSLAKARESARRVACASQLHQFAIALRMYGNDNRGWLPVANAYNGVFNDLQEYDFTVAGKTYTGNLTSLFPKYTSSKRIFLCPSFDGQDDPAYAFWFGWAERSGPLNPANYKRSNYVYTPWRNIAAPLVNNVGSAIYGQGSIRFGQKWSDGVKPITFSHTVIMSDVVADSRLIGYPEGYVSTLFASAHFRIHNLGGNALHGDSSVEWVPMSSGRWAWAGGGLFNVSDD